MYVWFVADGVTVVLYQVMQTFNLMSTIETNQVVLGFVKFVVVCIGGVFIGLLTGVISAILTRVTVHVGGKNWLCVSRG